MIQQDEQAGQAETGVVYTSFLGSMFPALNANTTTSGNGSGDLQQGGGGGIDEIPAVW
jgi:hypothetical protein